MQSREEVELDAAGDGSPDANEYDDTDASQMATIVGSRLNSVTANDGGTLTDETDRVIGEYTFTFERGTNRYSVTNLNGLTVEEDDAYAANLEELVLQLTTSSLVNVTNIQAYLEGNSSDKTDAVSAVAGEITLDLTTLDDSSFDGTVTLVIEGDVAFTADTGSVSLSTKIADLSTDFSYNGYSDALLKYTEVSGGYYSQVR
jgi:hypothetical protein